MWEYKGIENGGAVYSDGRYRLRLQAYSPELIRVTQTGHDSFTLNDAPMIAQARPAECGLDLSDEGGAFTADAGALCARLNAATGALSWYGDGKPIMAEPERNGRVLRPIDIIKYRFARDAEVEEYQTIDGVRSRAKGEPYVDRKGYQTKLSFAFDRDEDIYGLGQHEEGVLNYRGQHQFLYQHNLKISCPVLYSSKGWGLLNNCCGAQIFHDDAFGSYIAAEDADELDYFVIYGPEFDQILSRLRWLTGESPLLPRWALGYVQSKEHYASSQELIDIAAEYRRREIPIDCVVQDWQSWPEGWWGQKTPDPARYPDVQQLTDTLHGMNVKLMLSIWPNMNGDCPDQLELAEKGQMLGNQHNYNVYDPEARKTYWNQCERVWFRQGLDAWWADCTEPFEADWYGSEVMLPEDRMQFNLNEFKHYIDPTQVLTYSTYHAQGIYEGQRGATNDKRVTVLTRSGLTGQQRYATICWNGDTSARWDVLRKTIPDGLNLMLCGIAYWTVDAGAFFTRYSDRMWFSRGDYENGCDDPKYRELYVRWMQLSAFLPMMRSHGMSTPREVWRFGEPGEEYYDALVSIIKLRYTLMPYIYSEMARVHFDGTSMMRMLAFDFRQDSTARNIDDQFMFGHSMMVCPVVDPAGPDGKATRRVYLPAGVKWYDFWSDKKYDGGTWLEVSATINAVPIFVPEGGIIPTGPAVSYADEAPLADVTVRVYAGRDGVFKLYNDAGDGYAYEKGEYTLTTLRWNDSKGELTRVDEGDARYLCNVTLARIG